MTPDEYEELAAVYLRKLAAADMKAWREHQRTTERGGNEPDALSSLQAEKIEPHAQPPKPRKPYVLTEAGREKRKAQSGPVSAARATAIAAGENIYRRHTACKRCGGYLYYVTGQNCVACAKVASRKSEVKKRAAAKRAESATKLSVPRLSQFKRLDTFRAGSAPRVPRRAARR
jgi:ribosomal protein L37E